MNNIFNLSTAEFDAIAASLSLGSGSFALFNPAYKPVSHPLSSKEAFQEFATANLDNPALVFEGMKATHRTFEGMAKEFDLPLIEVVGYFTAAGLV